MIYTYGTRKKIKIDKSLGVMQCTNCGNTGEIALAHEACYAHFCYIPIFFYTGYRMKLCPCCGVMEKLSKNEFKAIKNS